MPNNEYAFPIMPPADRNGQTGQHYGYPYPENGMTLRDYFAAKAMQAIISDKGRAADPNWVASLAYSFAKAMIEVRS